MGLGKTLEVLALVIRRPRWSSSDPAPRQVFSEALRGLAIPVDDSVFDTTANTVTGTRRSARLSARGTGAEVCNICC